MHSDPSPHLHTEKCNNLVAELVQCRFEHPYGKFFGYCNGVDFAMTKCFREEKAARRLDNNKRAVDRLQKVIAKRKTAEAEGNAEITTRRNE